ncbi:ANTAR domain-containing protein [Bogoriella caseilytica]|uniref:GAF domain-containing protein n=1 Tax=Bogoriella caseilytica TaxID=56055 RepID=A0A3N2BEZ0_9MICO|nr:GAF and ANTAR domain-containing protein [Bogoriella caseilytica]ROR73828.1 GAF domain-containing protein [Bogoriella caseilytica]
MYDDRLFVQTLSDFVRTLVQPYDPDAALNDLALRVAEVLQIRGAGVSLYENNKLQMVTAIPPHLKPLELFQEEHQVGPAVEAFHTGTTREISDLAAERERWPEYVAAALGTGTTSIAVLPLALEDEAFGTLTLYAERRGWPESDIAAASVLADMATAYLINASTNRQHTELNKQLSLALDSRVVIEQAKGIIAEHCGVAVAQAFEMIRNHARRHNLKVRDLADAIVSMGLRL